jgi:DNA-binding MarR family transcriptional regulator
VTHDTTRATEPASGPGWDVDETVAAWAGVLKVHAALTPKLDRALKDAHDLPLTWYDILLELEAAPGRRLTMGELGRRALVSRTRAVRVVDELVRAGLVVRERHPGDRRSAYAAITQDGRRRLGEAAPTYLAGVRRHFSRHLTPAEATAVSGALTKVLDAVRGERDRSPP